MNNIKLSIFTGKSDTDIIDLGYYNPSIEGPFQVGMAGLQLPGSIQTIPELWQFRVLNGVSASWASTACDAVLNDMNANPDKYKAFHAADLLAAQNYLNQLKIACDTYPACTVKIETL